MFFDSMIQGLSLDCPLNFYAYVGDREGVEVFLRAEEWAPENANKALALACMLGHKGCVEAFMEHSVGVMIGPCAITHAFTQNHADILDIMFSNLDQPFVEEDIYPGLLWGIHMDHVDILSPVKKHCPHFLGNKSLESALISDAPKCIEFLVRNMNEKVKANVVNCLITTNVDLVPYLYESEYGAECDADILKRLKKKRVTVYNRVLKAMTKKRWRQVRSIVHIVRYWREFIYDYYSPGNSEFKRGKGFEAALTDFKALNVSTVQKG